MNPALEVRDLSASYDGDTLAIDSLSFSIPVGSLTAIVGPNGSGKSTTVKSIMGVIEPVSGEIKINGNPLTSASELVYVPQRSEIDWDFPLTVEDVVKQGLYPRLGLWKRPKKSDLEFVEQSMSDLGVIELRNRQIGELSGGQQQRTFLARALVQRGKIILMDEPFQGVDATTERAIVDLLHSLQSQGSTVVLVHHDISTVPQYFDHVLLLNRTVVAFGPTDTTFTRSNLQRTYGGRMAVFEDGSMLI